VVHGQADRVLQQRGLLPSRRSSYYRYFSWETNAGVALYQLQVYFTEGQTGFVVTGSTLNDRDRIREDGVLFTQLIGTLRSGL
jgi:hypothetical protein